MKLSKHLFVSKDFGLIAEADVYTNSMKKYHVKVGILGISRRDHLESKTLGIKFMGICLESKSRYLI